MPYINRRGNEMKQIAVWVPAALHNLAKADGLNVSKFLTEQLEALYEDELTVETLNEKFRLMAAAKESRKKQREVVAHAAANRERLKDNVRALRAERIIEKASQEDATVASEAHAANLGSVWEILVKKKRIIPSGLFRRLPENDIDMDHTDFWPALAQEVSTLAGEHYSEQEVIAYARAQVATC
jgi:post-segregation antitoxin (ccd killing protein)